MPITASISLTVTPLTDNEIAFANAAAWNSYWNDLSGNVTITPLSVTGYSPTAYVSATVPYELTVDADLYRFPSWVTFKALETAYLNLANNYDLLRAELYAAGLISDP